MFQHLSGCVKLATTVCTRFWLRSDQISTLLALLQLPIHSSGRLKSGVVFRLLPIQLNELANEETIFCLRLR